MCRREAGPCLALLTVAAHPVSLQKFQGHRWAARMAEAGAESREPRSIATPGSCRRRAERTCRWNRRPRAEREERSGPHMPAESKRLAARCTREPDSKGTDRGTNSKGSTDSSRDTSPRAQRRRIPHPRTRPATTSLLPSNSPRASRLSRTRPPTTLRRSSRRTVGLREEERHPCLYSSNRRPAPSHGPLPHSSAERSRGEGSAPTGPPRIGSACHLSRRAGPAAGCGHVTPEHRGRRARSQRVRTWVGRLSAGARMVA